MAFATVDEEAVYLCTGNPLPRDIEAVVNWLLNDDFTAAFRRISEYQVTKGIALVDIVRELHPWLFRIAALPPRTRIELVDRLADIEHRLAYGTSEALQLGSLVGVFSKAREDIVAAAT